MRHAAALCVSSKPCKEAQTVSTAPYRLGPIAAKGIHSQLTTSIKKTGRCIKTNVSSRHKNAVRLAAAQVSEADIAESAEQTVPLRPKGRQRTNQQQLCELYSAGVTVNNTAPEAARPAHVGQPTVGGSSGSDEDDSAASVTPTHARKRGWRLRRFQSNPSSGRDSVSKESRSSAMDGFQLASTSELAPRGTRPTTRRGRRGHPSSNTSAQNKPSAANMRQPNPTEVTVITAATAVPVSSLPPPMATTMVSAMATPSTNPGPADDKQGTQHSHMAGVDPGLALDDEFGDSNALSVLQGRAADTALRDRDPPQNEATGADVTVVAAASSYVSEQPVTAVDASEQLVAAGATLSGVTADLSDGAAGSTTAAFSPRDVEKLGMSTTTAMASVGTDIIPSVMMPSLYSAVAPEPVSGKSDESRRAVAVAAASEAVFTSAGSGTEEQSARSLHVEDSAASIESLRTEVGRGAAETESNSQVVAAAKMVEDLALIEPSDAPEVAKAVDAATVVASAAVWESAALMSDATSSQLLEELKEPQQGAEAVALELQQQEKLSATLDGQEAAFNSAGVNLPGAIADSAEAGGDVEAAVVLPEFTSSPVANGDGELDDTALAISVLAAAAAVAGGHHSHPYAPRGATRRRTSTWELRPPARRPPRVVPFEVGGLRELQALVDSVNGPTIIDLQGAMITLGQAAVQSAPPPGEGQRAKLLPPSPPSVAATTATTALVPTTALHVPGWSSVAELISERIKLLEGSTADSSADLPLSSSSVFHQNVEHYGGSNPFDSLVGSNGSGSPCGSSGGVLLLHRDHVTLANGTLHLHKGSRLLVTGRRVTLRKIEVVDAEAAAWWRLATAFPATCLQSSALITVTSPTNSGQYGKNQQGALAINGHRSGGGEGPSLELDDCSIIASGRDRDLIRVDGDADGASAAALKGAAKVTARYSRLHGGANAAVARQGAALSLDCCELEGYTAAGVVALGATVRLVGSRLLGATGSIVGLQAVAASKVNALGCFFKGHASNVECMGGSSVDMQGCVLARPDCRYGLTIHSAGTSAAGSLDLSSSDSAGAASGGSSGGGRSPLRGGNISAATATAVDQAGRIRLTDCELGHAVQLGGGELEMERCTFALRPAPADTTVMPVQITSDPALAAKLAAAVLATATVRTGGGGSSASVREGTGAAFAGTVAAAASLRLVGCRVGGGGEGEAVVVEAADMSRVHVSGSHGVLIRRYGSLKGSGTS